MHISGVRFCLLFNTFEMFPVNTNEGKGYLNEYFSSSDIMTDDC